MRRLFVLLLLTLAVGCISTLAVFRAALVAPRPALLAALVIALSFGLVAELAFVCVQARKRMIRPLAAGGRALLLVGLLATLAGGTVNWLLSLQGYVVLVEGETTRLGAGGQLEGLETGPLGDPHELEVDLALVKVELAPAGGGTFNPVSLIETRRAAGAIRMQTIGGGRVAEVGPLLLRQGAFGYAPRIVVLRQRRSIFDRVVPFTTRRDGAGGTSFSAELHLQQERLEISGTVSLDSLDDRLQGHPALRLTARRDGKDLGAGELLPGQFAELADGYRLGFAGLKKWSEVDVARRNYRIPMVVGSAVSLLGVVVWALASWRKW